MTHLTPEERVLGRENANRALGVSRRDCSRRPPPYRLWGPSTSATRT